VGRADWEPQFTEYFTARVQPLRRLAYGLCGDWHTAEDIVQLTFVRLYSAWPRVRIDSVDHYTRRVLVNVFLSHRRTRRWEALTASPPERPAPDGPAVADRLALHAALARLAPRQRAVVVLRHLEELSVAEVAELLRVSEGTVKSQTARGLETLREAITDRSDDHV
jgi:RNA polymerase sigma-70 factor (sigma-E family)